MEKIVGLCGFGDPHPSAAESPWKFSKVTKHRKVVDNVRTGAVLCYRHYSRLVYSKIKSKCETEIKRIKYCTNIKSTFFISQNQYTCM